MDNYVRIRGSVCVILLGFTCETECNALNAKNNCRLEDIY